MRISTVAFASLAALAGGALWSASPARAFIESRPAAACADQAADMRVPGLWLGHFTGGRLTRADDGSRALAWRDDYSCFASARACAAWRKSLGRTYRDQAGYGTCEPLRGGGTPIGDAGGLKARF